MLIDELLSHFTRVEKHGKYYQCQCPAHDDKKNSLTITPDTDKMLIHCQAGCGVKDVLKAAGLEMGDLYSNSSKVKSEKPHISKVYDYTDADGKLLFQCVRYIPKDFKQRRPDGNGDFIWNLDGVTTVLYHLPEVIQAVKEGKPVVLIEGEKDTDNVREWGYVATTSPMGAGKWREGYTETLKGATRVVLIAHKDGPGRKHMKTIAAELCGLVGKLKLFEMPDIPGHKIKDFTNWLEAGGTKEEFEELIKNTPEWTPDNDESAPVGRKSLPRIVCNNRSLDYQGNDAFKAIMERNNPPVILIRNRKMVEVVKNEVGTPTIEVGTRTISELNKDAVRCVCAQNATFVNAGEKNETEISPPLDIVENMMAKIGLGIKPFPILRSISESPYISEDGTIVTEPGYNPNTQIFYVPAPNFKMPEIPEKPDSSQVEAAENLLLEVICDFPFDSDASRANCLATILTPILRPSINGRAPLAIFDKPQPRTGASLLANVVSAIGTGREPLMLNWPHDDAELQKALATFLKEGQTIIIYDNAEGAIFSQAFSLILTAPIIAMRLLGGNESIEVPNQNTWIMTGNNLRLDGELIDRSYRIGLDAQSAHPGERKIEFKHDKLIKWILDERGRIIAAILTIYRAWVDAGQPKATIIHKIGGFDEWVDLTSAILEFIGIPSFLANLSEMYDRNDTETPQWESFVLAWHDVISEPVTCAELVGYLNNNNDFAAVLPDSLDRTAKDFTTNLGKTLHRKMNVRYACGLMIKKGKIIKKRALTWEIIEIGKVTSPNFETNGEVSEVPLTPARQKYVDDKENKEKNTYIAHPPLTSYTSPPHSELGEVTENENKEKQPEGTDLSVRGVNFKKATNLNSDIPAPSDPEKVVNVTVGHNLADDI